MTPGKLPKSPFLVKITLTSPKNTDEPSSGKKNTSINQSGFHERTPGTPKILSHWNDDPKFSKSVHPSQENNSPASQGKSLAKNIISESEAENQNPQRTYKKLGSFSEVVAQQQASDVKITPSKLSQPQVENKRVSQNKLIMRQTSIDRFVNGSSKNITFVPIGDRAKTINLKTNQHSLRRTELFKELKYVEKQTVRATQENREAEEQKLTEEKIKNEVPHNEDQILESSAEPPNRKKKKGKKKKLAPAAVMTDKSPYATNNRFYANGNRLSAGCLNNLESVFPQADNIDQPPSFSFNSEEFKLRSTLSLLNNRAKLDKKVVSPNLLLAKQPKNDSSLPLIMKTRNLSEASGMEKKLSTEKKELLLSIESPHFSRRESYFLPDNYLSSRGISLPVSPRRTPMSSTQASTFKTTVKKGFDLTLGNKTPTSNTQAIIKDIKSILLNQGSYKNNHSSSNRTTNCHKLIFF